MSAVTSRPRTPTERRSQPLTLRDLHRFTIDQYHRLTETGILTAKDRVELLEGWIIEKMTFNPPHNATIIRVNRRLTLLLPEEWLLQVQGAVTLRDSEPEPDFAVIRGPESQYSTRKPVARDVAIVIEAADSSLLEDRRYKTVLYAAARIAEYWIINLVNLRIEVHTQPRAGKSPQYRQTRNYGLDEVIPLVLEGMEIARIPVRDLLPVGISGESE
jgi:Uma2 family endonuclease